MWRTRRQSDVTGRSHKAFRVSITGGVSFTLRALVALALTSLTLTSLLYLFYTPVTHVRRLRQIVEQQVLTKDGGVGRDGGFIQQVKRSVVYSAIITTFGEDKEDVYKCIDRIASAEFQKIFYAMEVIVVNDGHPDLKRFVRLAEEYANSPGEQVESVDTKLAKGVAADDLLPDGSISAAVIHRIPRSGTEGIQVIFASKPNGGLGSARNFGISLASGLWIHPVDADDGLDPNFAAEITDALGRHVHLHWKLEGNDFRSVEEPLTLENPHFYNVIMPGMGTQEGKPLPWQPYDVSTIDLHYQNFAHCCGLFLRSVWKGGIKYNPLLVFGWEDWDFWLNFHTKIGIEALMVKKPLYLYSSWGQDKEPRMHNFCVTYHSICRAYFHVVNFDKYDNKILTTALELLVIDGLKVLQKHPGWRLVIKLARLENPVAQLLQLLASKKSSLESLQYLARAHCEDSKFVNLINLLANGSAVELRMEMNEEILAGVRLRERNESKEVRFLPVQSECPQVLLRDKNTLTCEALESILQEEIANNPNPLLFHFIISQKPTDEKRISLMHHSITSVLVNHPSTKVLIHTFVENTADLFHEGFLKHWRGQLLLVSSCSSRLALVGNMSNVETFVRSKIRGRPFAYSHMTDYYRFLVLYTYGGVYLDTDIVLRTSVEHLHNAAVQETELFTNGAFLSFDRKHEFLKQSLWHIEERYSPFVWSSIGPHLVTEMVHLLAGTQNEVDVLPKEALYYVPWQSASDLLEVPIERSSYEELGSVNAGRYRHLGYHFWMSSNNFFSGVHEVREDSLGGWVLRDSCVCGIMTCLMEVCGTDDDNSFGLRRGGPGQQK